MDDLLELGIFFWFKLIDSHLLKPTYKIFNLFMDEKSFKNLDFAYITAVLIIISWQYPTFSEIFELKVTK